MKWIVGIDLRYESDGPIHFAAWLAKHTQIPSKQEMLGIHVLEQQGVQLALGLYGPDGIQMAQNLPTVKELQARAQQVLIHTVERANARRYFSELQLVANEDAEKSIIDLAKTNQCNGIIVGRRAKRGKDRLVRLGRVARRLLRHLPKPIIVTPPDLKLENLGEGPILIACDAHEDSLAACRFGIDLAKQLQREVLLVYIVEIPEDWAHAYLSSEMLANVQQNLQSQGQTIFDTWLKSHDLQQYPHEIVQGDVVHQFVTMVTNKASPLVVCGSRKLGAVTRFFIASVGTEFAARLPCPVAVVPPDLYA